MDTYSAYSVRYIDHSKSLNGTERHFATEDERAEWIDRNADHIEVLAFADPESRDGAQS